MGGPQTASRILTLVFTDLVSSTALKTERGDQAAGALVARHREHVRALAQDSGGRIVSWAGDGCFLTFDTPSAAVIFALGLQKGQRDENDLPRVRVGIHIGEVSEQSSPSGVGSPDVAGLAVDLASRICSLAVAEQILLSAAVADSTRPRVDSTFAGLRVCWQTHGRYSLKGFDKPVEICEVGLEGIAPLVAPAANEKAMPTGIASRPSAHGGPITNRAKGLVAAIVIAAAVAVTYVALEWREEGATAVGKPSAIRSLAVLPFDNFSGDREQDYFADGMTEALISELSKIRSLRVISRTSVMQYKGTEKPAPQVARELGVDGLIEGSVYKGGDEVRITAQLIRGATDEHLWAANYTESLENVLKLQSNVALAISRELRVHVTNEEARRLAVASGTVPEAHTALGDFDEAFRWIRKGMDERDYSVVSLNAHPNLAPLRGDPRFKELVKEMGLGD